MDGAEADGGLGATGVGAASILGMTDEAATAGTGGGSAAWGASGVATGVCTGVWTGVGMGVGTGVGNVVWMGDGAEAGLMGGGGGGGGGGIGTTGIKALPPRRKDPMLGRGFATAAAAAVASASSSCRRISSKWAPAAATKLPVFSFSLCSAT